MLLPGAIDDASWSQSGYEGLRQIERDLSAQIVYEVNITDTESAERFRAYAEQGYDLIIGHGNQFYQSAEVIAAEFPRTKFVVVGNFPGNNRNLGTVSFRDGETGYLVGVVAALKTKTQCIAYIGGVENAAQLEAAALVERGAQSIRPTSSLRVLWLNSWTDEAKAAEVTKQQIDSGCDVIIQNADAAGRGVFRAAEQAGAYTIGWAQDQHELAPNTVLTSAIQRVPVLLVNAATLVRRGRWEGKRYAFGLREGALDLAPFRGLLSQDEVRIVQQVREDIMTGKINTLP